MKKVEEGQEIKVTNKKGLTILSASNKISDLRAAESRLFTNMRSASESLFEEIFLLFPEIKDFHVEYDHNVDKILIGRSLTEGEKAMRDATEARKESK